MCGCKPKDEPMKKVCIALLLGAVLMGRADADVLANWNSTGATPQADDFAPNAVAEGLVVSNLVRGSGIAAYTTPGNAYVANGYAESTNTTAMTGGDYWEVQLTPEEDHHLLFSTLTYSFRATANGPKFSQWAYSLNGTTFTWLGEPDALSTAYTTRTVDISAIAELQGVDERVIFRLAAWGGNAEVRSTGVFGQSKDVLTFEGTVVSLAAPPTVAFSPATLSVPVSNTLVVSVQALPEGSAATDCAISPTPVGRGEWHEGNSTFTFTPAAADEGVAFTLTAIATNRFGEATNSAPLTVTRFMPAGSYAIDFENQNKGGYPAAPVAFDGVNWNLEECRIYSLSNAVGAKALNFRFNGAESIFVSLEPVPTAGVGMISFMYCAYNSTYDGPNLAVEVSNAPDGPWVMVGMATAAATAGQQWFSFYPAMREAAYVRFRCLSGSEGYNSVLDDIIISPYAAFAPGAESYEAFLLRYNVTPGDARTGLADDYDGDGATNEAEWIAGTNPFDKTSHP